eukprot:283175-Pyramimonas_sp.AAC.1
MKYPSEKYDADFIRPCNGHGSPGIKCRESLYFRDADLSAPGSPCYFIHGTQWAVIPSIFSIGLACPSDDTRKTRGIQFVHGCPYLPGDNRMQCGLRVDSEVLVM